MISAVLPIFHNHVRRPAVELEGMAQVGSCSADVRHCGLAIIAGEVLLPDFYSVRRHLHRTVQQFDLENCISLLLDLERLCLKFEIVAACDREPMFAARYALGIFGVNGELELLGVRPIDREAILIEGRHNLVVIDLHAATTPSLVGQVNDNP